MQTKRNINIKRIHTSKRSIFRYWLEFLKPYHKLRPKEIEALSLLLFYRYELSLEVSNEELINTLLFSDKSRRKIREELGDMDNKVFNNLLTSLRKKNVLGTDNKINPVLIPNMSEDGFKLIFDFEIKNE
jgi:hypothetical protein